MNVISISDAGKVLRKWASFVRFEQMIGLYGSHNRRRTNGIFEALGAASGNAGIRADLFASVRETKGLLG